MKDLLNMKRIGKHYLLVLAVMCVWSLWMKNSSFVSMYLVLCSSMLVLSSFAYDEQGQFDKYALTMPITRRTLVKAKYALYLILVLGGMLFGILAGHGVGSIGRSSNVSQEGMTETGLAVGAVFLIVYGILIPVIYKIGVEKARLLMVGIYLALFGLIYGLIWLGKRRGLLVTVIGMSEQQLVRLAVLGLFFFALLVVIVSYLVSVQIVEKKEF